MVRDQPARKLAVPARHQHLSRAAVHRAQHAVHHAGDVEHRHHAEADRFGRGVAPLTAHRVVHQGPVRVHAALGQAGRARGVGQHREVVGARRVRTGREAHRQHVVPAQAALGQRRIRAQPGVHRRWRRVGRIERAFRHGIRVARHQHVARARFGCELRLRLSHRGGEVGAADDDPRAGIGDVVLQFLGAVHRVHRHHHGIGAHDAVEGGRVLRTVLQVDRDPVAGRHADALQPARDRLGLRTQFAVAQGAAEEDVGRLVGKADRRDLQVDPERGLGRDDRVRQALRPDREVRAVGRDVVGVIGEHAGLREANVPRRFSLGAAAPGRAPRST